MLLLTAVTVPLADCKRGGGGGQQQYKMETGNCIPVDVCFLHGAEIKVTADEIRILTALTSTTLRRRCFLIVAVES
jgi:hypothetical protein